MSDKILFDALRAIGDFPVIEGAYNVDVAAMMTMAHEALEEYEKVRFLIKDVEAGIYSSSGVQLPNGDVAFSTTTIVDGETVQKEQTIGKMHPSWIETAPEETLPMGFRSVGWNAIWRIKEGHALKAGHVLHRSKLVATARDAQLIVDQWESREPSAQFSFDYAVQELFARVSTPQEPKSAPQGTNDVLTSTHYTPTVDDDLGTEYPMGVCVVIAANDQPDEFLAVSRRGNGNLWGFPGGKVDSDETCADAAVRELMEETGFRTSTTMLVPIYRSLCPGDVTYDVVTYMYIGNAPTLLDLTPEDDLGLDYVTGDLLTDPETSPFAEYNLGVMAAVDQITANS